MVDFGYDISDFYDIHDEYGTMEDFLELLDKAHELGKLCLIALTQMDQKQTVQLHFVEFQKINLCLSRRIVVTVVDGLLYYRCY